MPHISPSLDEHFEHHYDDLVAWCRKHVSPVVGEPEEFVHGAYLRCRSNWRDDRQSLHHAAGYLFRSLRWEVLDALGRHRRRNGRQRDGAVDDLTGHGQSPLGMLIACEALETLPRQQREACETLLSGKSAGDYAVQSGRSAGAIAVSLSRARASLRRYFRGL